MEDSDMTVYEFLAPGFEIAEAMTPYDMLLRGGADVKLISITSELTVRSAQGVSVQADLTLSRMPKEIPDLVLLPGGMPGAQNLRESEEVCRTVVRTAEHGGYVAAICAAPFVLGELGLLRGKRATCYPGFEDRLEGAVYEGGKVVCDGGVITAAGMGCAQEFGYALVKTLFGAEEANRVLAQIMAL